MEHHTQRGGASSSAPWELFAWFQQQCAVCRLRCARGACGRAMERRSWFSSEWQQDGGRHGGLGARREAARVAGSADNGSVDVSGRKRMTVTTSPSDAQTK